jgi:predicted RNA binding protein YcfA (HicA-like mRNA interferase family)
VVSSAVWRIRWAGANVAGGTAAGIDAENAGRKVLSERSGSAVLPYFFRKYRDIVKMVEKDGWRLVSQEGSHRQFKHPVKRGRVTIAGHPSKDAAPGTFEQHSQTGGT